MKKNRGMIKWRHILFAAVLYVAGCTNTRHMSHEMKTVYLDTLPISALEKRPVYHPSRKRIVDLVHTTLHVHFDWEKQHLIGQATLILTPYFYPVSDFRLDAKGFDINKIALSESDSMIDIKYEYDSLKLFIHTGSVFFKGDTFKIFIDYIAKPNELPEGGSLAIASNKGLFFINPLNEVKGKPQQIWTQGETESNSAWFPTIDAPNEKMTQDIFITVEDRFTTLSNGLLISKEYNADGSRTDHWKQSLPHAPYLCMMAIGEYAKITDYWHRSANDSMEVSYYVEPEYGKYARAIFGNTVEMIDFYSELLGVPYPWEKFSQVVVRDYVSGAMENTSSVVHGEFLQQTSREMLDGNNEDVISHELFHHWFGDYVTCESWANIPLNESFATYGEYLWREYKYGRASADQLLQKKLSTYLMEARQKQVDMIRFNYDDKEDMFDSHSYAKGGCILHMLRKYVGDTAFFQSLNLFLKSNAFKPVEMHQLRLAFEEITGEDLNWFFNQWFFSSGHPHLLISYRYDSLRSREVVTIEQTQDLAKTPLYKLPMAIDIYEGGKVRRDTICLKKQKQEFTFQVSSEPELVNVDAEKMLLCLKEDKKDLRAFMYQYRHAPLYLDRYEAIKACGKQIKNDSLAAVVILEALQDPNWNLRLLAMRKTPQLIFKYPEIIREKLIHMALYDEKSSVRALAIDKLSGFFPSDSGLIRVYRQAMKDSSYTVIRHVLSAIVQNDKEEGLRTAKEMEKEHAAGILLAISNVYAQYGSDEQAAFFIRASEQMSGMKQLEFVMNYQQFLKRTENPGIIDEGIAYFHDLSTNNTGFIKYFVKQALSDLRTELEKRSYQIEDAIQKAQKVNEQEQAEQLLRQSGKLKQQINAIKTIQLSNSEEKYHIKIISGDAD